MRQTGCKLNFSQRGCRVHFLPGASPEVKKFPKEEEAHHAGEASTKGGNGDRKPVLRKIFPTDPDISIYFAHMLETDPAR
jgi:hypothetical protein